MNLVLTVLEIVAPVFLLAAVGFVWVKLDFEYRLQFVTRLSATLATPCLIFTALMKTEVSPEALAVVSLAALVAYAGISALAFGLLRIAKLDLRTFLNPMVVGNTGNLGLPLALFAFGDQGLGYALVIFAVCAILTFSVGIWLVSGGGSPVKLIREPMIWATLLGALFLSQGWQTPGFLTTTLEMIGQLAIPLMLITLGVAVARLHPAGLTRAFWMALVRVPLCLAVAVAVGLWFGLDRIAFGVLVVQMSTPVAVTSYLLAEKYGADSDAVAGLVVVSTLLAVATLPLTLAFVI